MYGNEVKKVMMIELGHCLFASEIRGDIRNREKKAKRHK